MKVKKRLLLSILLGVWVLLLTACGNEQREVPSSVIEMLVAESEYYDPNYDCSIVKIHSWDEDANRDTVALTLTVNGRYGKMSVNSLAVYEYNESSELWSLVKQTGWSEPVYSYNSNLCAGWTIQSYDNTYRIEVVSVDGDKIKVNCWIKEYVRNYSNSAFCEAYAEGTYVLNGQWLEIPFDLPEGFFVSWHDTVSGENEYSTELTIGLDIHEGIENVYVYPSIYLF